MELEIAIFLYGFAVISFGNFRETCLQCDGFQSIFPSSRRETMKSQVLQKFNSASLKEIRNSPFQNPDAENKI